MPPPPIVAIVHNVTGQTKEGGGGSTGYAVGPCKRAPHHTVRYAVNVSTLTSECDTSCVSLQQYTDARARATCGKQGPLPRLITRSLKAVFSPIRGETPYSGLVTTFVPWLHCIALHPPSIYRSSYVQLKTSRRPALQSPRQSPLWIHSSAASQLSETSSVTRSGSSSRGGLLIVMLFLCFRAYHILACAGSAVIRGRRRRE
ncbi:hypothetical protein V8C26DRAFT_122946 [Trichoderma gracile]